MRTIISFALCLTTLWACQEAKALQPKETVGQVELTTFKVKNGIDRGKFLQSANNLKQYLAACDGFISRKMIQVNDSTFTDVVFWKTKEQAENAAKNSMANPTALDFFQYIDEKSILMQYGMPKSEF
jgi:secreted protein with Ig-like and vWFA domain